MDAFFLFYSSPLVYGYILCLKLRRQKVKNHIQIENPLPFYEALEHAITESAAGCLKLGGYIVIFQILFLIPVIFLQEDTPVFAILSSLFEITAGLTFFHDLHPFIWSQVLAISLPLALLQFGGLSFLFQTLGFIKGTGLSIRSYLMHNLLLGVFTFFIFCVFFWLSFVWRG